MAIDEIVCRHGASVELGNLLFLANFFASGRGHDVLVHPTSSGFLNSEISGPALFAICVEQMMARLLHHCDCEFGGGCKSDNT